MSSPDAEKLSRDLTLILVRGNGTPRAFRIRVSSLARGLLSLTGLFFALSLLSVIAVALLLFKGGLPKIEVSAPAISTPARPITAAPADLDAIPAPESVLREELTKLQNTLEGRKELSPSTGETGALPAVNPIQLLAPNSTLLPEKELFIQARNLRTNRTDSTVTLDFDLQNTHPQQKQIRGYIVVLAKTASALYAFPENALTPRDNFLINYARGETFAISRFRQASAKFQSIPVNSGPISFQVLLFDHNGKVLINSHLEGK